MFASVPTAAEEFVPVIQSSHVWLTNYEILSSQRLKSS